MAYRTTRQIRSLANGGVNLAPHQSVSRAAFTDAHWAALLADGAVVEVGTAVASKPEQTAVNLDDLSLDQLKTLADERGVSYTWNIKADTLKARLNDA